MKVHPMSEASKETRKYRKHDKEFKRHAVSLWLDGNRSAAEVAKELGINDNLLYAWKKDFGPSSQKPLSQAELEAEVAALRRENAQLRQQREVLKKTLGILSDSPGNGINGSTR
jgi:transposase